MSTHCVEHSPMSQDVSSVTSPHILMKSITTYCIGNFSLLTVGKFFIAHFPEKSKSARWIGNFPCLIVCKFFICHVPRKIISTHWMQNLPLIIVCKCFIFQCFFSLLNWKFPLDHSGWVLHSLFPLDQNQCPLTAFETLLYHRGWVFHLLYPQDRNQVCSLCWKFNLHIAGKFFIPMSLQ